MSSSSNESAGIDSRGATHYSPTGADASHSSLAQLFAAVALITAKVDAIHQLIAGAVKSFYTIAEVAKITGRSDYSVRRWVSVGKISAIRVGDSGPRGKLLIPREELERLIARGQGSKIPAAVCGSRSSAEHT